ncbi:mitochondrial inner membrane protein oxa1-1 [Colletotrichum spaethianum]|uniref:Mitochondrial inner membrane protein oxa1-1 n=1 Tax=Colletotrichum spaethianum TaxID=700344 RepID=A0AA37PCX2_9PEZI|nr:mitochondrial inner membrane protein oxa1-1 [Colletotrichum spaethianum]GKT49973.1 mitochondrial inner membrane protein oxa1-1 [Colletotrichum spaethianum]
MASLKAARCAIVPGLRQPLGLSTANSLSQSAFLRPTLRPMAPHSIQRTTGARNISMGAYVENSVQATGEALIWLNSLGSTGHWGTTIIFAAFAVAVVRTPLQMIAKHIVNKQTETMPLLNAWRFQFRANRLSGALQLARTRKRLLKERGCQDWKAWAPALGIPIWFLMSETLRRLCGARGGWLSLLSGNYKDTTQPAVGAAAASVPEQASTALSSSVEAVSNGLQSLGSTVEAGMANGGMLWFTDLTVADPTMALPGILMLTMGYTMFPKQEEMRKLVFDFGNSQAYMTPGLKWRVRLQRGLLVSAILVPALCSNLPAGLFVYWIASMAFTQVSGKVVDRVFPKPHTVQPCRHREPIILPVA